MIDIKAVIATRSMTPELYEMAVAALPLPLKKIPFRGTTAEGYLLGLLDLDAHWVINIDEDAFVFDPARIMGIFGHMIREGYICCGMPDGGAVDIRIHNPLVPNPFFNIIHLAEVRSFLNARPLIRDSAYDDSMKMFHPPFAHRTAFAYDMFEPYYRFFLWMISHGERILYFDARQWEDGISTILLDHEGAELLIHGWYGRDFHKDRSVRDRYARIIDSWKKRRSWGSDKGASS